MLPTTIHDGTTRVQGARPMWTGFLYTTGSTCISGHGSVYRKQTWKNAPSTVDGCRVCAESDGRLCELAVNAMKYSHTRPPSTMDGDAVLTCRYPTDSAYSKK